MLLQAFSYGAVLDRMIRESSPSVPADSALERLPTEEVVRLVESGQADAELAALSASQCPEICEAAQARARILRKGLQWP